MSALHVGDKIRVQHPGNVFDGWTGEIIKINYEGPFPVWANLIDPRLIVLRPDIAKEDDVPLHASEVVLIAAAQQQPRLEGI